jgi:hypothetical protein
MRVGRAPISSYERRAFARSANPSIANSGESIVSADLERIRAFGDANRHSNDGVRVGEIPYDGLDSDDVACMMDVVAYPRNRDGRTFVGDLVANLDSK